MEVSGLRLPTAVTHMKPDSAFGFKTQHPRNGIQDPSRRRLQNQTPIGLNSNGAEYWQNNNFIKPRQTQDVDPLSRASTEVHFPTSEASASGPAIIQTSSVDAIPTEHMAITTTSDRKTSTTTQAKQYDAPTRVSSRSNKGIAPRCYGFDEWHFPSIVTIQMTCNFQVLTTFVFETVYVSGFVSTRQKDCQIVTKAKTSFSFEEREMLCYQHWFINLLTVLLFQHLFQIKCLSLLFYIPEGYSPLSRCLSLQQLFSLYLASIEISCVWINVVDIKPNLCITCPTTISTDSWKLKGLLSICIS